MQVLMNQHGRRGQETYILMLTGIFSTSELAKENGSILVHDLSTISERPKAVGESSPACSPMTAFRDGGPSATLGCGKPGFATL